MSEFDEHRRAIYAETVDNDERGVGERASERVGRQQEPPMCKSLRRN
jgi:hypothetical protein